MGILNCIFRFSRETQNSTLPFITGTVTHTIIDLLLLYYKMIIYSGEILLLLFTAPIPLLKYRTGTEAWGVQGCQVEFNLVLL